MRSHIITPRAPLPRRKKLSVSNVVYAEFEPALIVPQKAGVIFVVGYINLAKGMKLTAGVGGNTYVKKLISEGSRAPPSTDVQRVW